MSRAFKKGDTVKIQGEMYIVKDVYWSDYCYKVHFSYAGTKFNTNYEKVVQYNQDWETREKDIVRFEPHVTRAKKQVNSNTVDTEDKPKIRYPKTYTDLLRGF